MGQHTVKARIGLHLNDMGQIYYLLIRFQHVCVAYLMFVCRIFLKVNNNNISINPYYSNIYTYAYIHASPQFLFTDELYMQRQHDRFFVQQWHQQIKLQLSTGGFIISYSRIKKSYSDKSQKRKGYKF